MSNGYLGKKAQYDTNQKVLYDYDKDKDSHQLSLGVFRKK